MELVASYVIVFIIIIVFSAIYLLGVLLIVAIIGITLRDLLSVLQSAHKQLVSMVKMKLKNRNNGGK